MSKAERSNFITLAGGAIIVLVVIAKIAVPLIANKYYNEGFSDGMYSERESWHDEGYAYTYVDIEEAYKRGLEDGRVDGHYTSYSEGYEEGYKIATDYIATVILESMDESYRNRWWNANYDLIVENDIDY